MGRAHQNVVSLDAYLRVGKKGKVSYPLAGYEFVIPKKGPMYKTLSGQSDRFSYIRRQGSSIFLSMRPRPSTSSDLHYWSVGIKHPRTYNDHVIYARVCMWALGLLVEGSACSSFDDKTFSTDVICHHKHNKRIWFKGKRYKMADDCSRANLNAMFRGAHCNLHHNS